MTRTKKPEPPVTARQLRRHYALLSKVAEKVLALSYEVQALRSELGERWRTVDLELEQLGAVIPTLPRWTKEQREAFEAGDTDRMISVVLEDHRCDYHVQFSWGLERCYLLRGHIADHRFGNRLQEITEKLTPPPKQANGEPWDCSPGAVNVVGP
jgi:hypothetical protein